MTAWQAVLLGIVQGLTEFLPVSSSGHLVLVGAVLEIHDNGIAFEIFAHFGTLLAVLTAFNKEFAKMLKELAMMLALRPRVQNITEEASDASNPRSLLLYLAVATVPSAILGYLLRGVIESSFAYPQFASGMLLVTGAILLLSSKAKEKHVRLNLGNALVIGLAQVVAFLPGISRSGTTITTGMLLGIQPVESARFSFLLAVPLILGVSSFKFFELLNNPPSNAQILSLIVGCVTAYVSGLLAIKWLMGIVKKGRFALFAYYCFAAGMLGLALSSF